MNSFDTDECEEFECSFRKTCSFAYLGRYFCSHYCQTNHCAICIKSNCKHKEKRETGIEPVPKEK